MEWLEVSIDTESEAVEIIVGMLMNIGITSLIIEDEKELKSFFENKESDWDYIDEEKLKNAFDGAKVKFYLSDNIFGMESLAQVKSNIKMIKKIDFGINLGSLDIKIENKKEEDWVDNWKKYYKTFQLGEKIIIKPVWENYEGSEGKIVFSIEPGSAFGTGLHQTTQLSILQLEKYINSESRVLDLGCGTGILSIISILLGAKEATAIDIDPNASKIAYENAELNNINLDKYNVYSGNILENIELEKKVLDNQYNIVVSNIVADVIIQMIGIVKKALNKGDIFISSGIIDERKDEVINKLKENGFSIIEVTEKEGWVCITAKNE